MKKLFDFLLFCIFSFAFSGSLYSFSAETSSGNSNDDYSANPQSVNILLSDSGKVEKHEITSVPNNQNFLNSDTFPDEKHESSFRVFPNPASEKIFIRFYGWDGETEIKILDITGRIALQIKSAKENNEIDITSLPKGIYLIHARNLTQHVVSKLKIQ